jgi:hypothetical protein
MSDKELLELAAKAAGIDVVRSRLDDPMNQDFLVNKSHRNEHQASGPWNPLTDDGDALRLAVKLNLFIQINSGSATAWKWQGENWYEQASDNADDMSATTRRAIVRAAAEIGKTMENKNV